MLLFCPLSTMTENWILIGPLESKHFPTLDFLPLVLFSCSPFWFLGKMSKPYWVFKVRDGSGGWCGTVTVNQKQHVPGELHLLPPDSHIGDTRSCGHQGLVSSPWEGVCGPKQKQQLGFCSLCWRPSHALSVFPSFELLISGSVLDLWWLRT